MSWAKDPWTEGTWAAGVIPNTAIPGQELPPSIPGATGTYTWGIQAGARPWAYGGWAGITSPVIAAVGGIVAQPDPDNGVARVMVWWPDATDLELIRITPDGARAPVRGGFPVRTIAATRRNGAPNPSAAAGLAGFVPGVGNPTLSQIIRSDTGASAWRLTVATANECEVVIPATLSAAPTVTIGVDLRISQRPTAVTVAVGWLDIDGNPLTAAVGTLSANAVNSSIGQFSRQIVEIRPPSGAETCSTVKLSATGLPLGATVDGAGVTIEQGLTDGSAFDGSSLGGNWDGVIGLSTSTLAPVLTVVDGECPLDLPVVYQVYHPAIVGLSAVTPQVVLDSGNRSWLSHVASPGKPLICYPTKTPSPVRALTQTVLPIMGRTFPAVLTFGPRQAPKDTLVFDCPTFDYQAALLDLLDDGSPLLLRAPAGYAYGPGQWMAFGDATEDPGGRPASMPGRSISVPYQEVDAPTAANLLAA